MKAMLLAAGKGERLGKSTNGLPKVLLPVCDRPILEHNLLYLKRFGIQEVMVNLFYKANVVYDFLKEKRFLGMDLDFSHEDRLMGTAGAIKKVEDYFGKHSFLVLYGDNLLDFDLRRLSAVHKQSKSIATLGVYKPGKTKWSGVAAGLIKSDKTGRITKFMERRGNKSIPRDVWINAGIYMLSPRIFQYIPENKSFDFGRDLFPKLIHENDRLQVSDGANYVLASDDLESLKRTRRLAKGIIRLNE